MKIGIIGSMQFTEKMLQVRDELQELGQEAFVTSLAAPFVGKSDEEKEEIKLHQKNNCDAIREFWRLMQGAEAVLVLNLDKNGIKNYIGGNTLMEMGFAHVLDQQIFLYNPVPEIPFYQTEIEAMKPVILHGDLSRLPGRRKATEFDPTGVIAFLKEVEKLKHVERAIMVSGQRRFENSAEHSWHVAWAVMLLARQFPQANVEKMLKMALLHDVVEIYAGDVPAFQEDQKRGQHHREMEAAKKIFGQLSPRLQQEFMQLFEEFEEEKTVEAKVVRSCDRLQAMIQNILSEGKTLKDNKIDQKWVENYHQPKMVHSEISLMVYELLMNEFVEKGLTWQG